MTLRSLFVVALLLVSACGGSSTPESTTPEAEAAVLPFGEFAFNVPSGEVTVGNDGVFRENGDLVGTFSADGGFRNMENVEIGRLTPSGQIYFGGRLESAKIEGTALVEGEATVASFDSSGNIVVNGPNGPATIAVRGYSPEISRTVMFTFAMYSALFSVAQQNAAPAEGAAPAEEAPAP